MHLAVVAWNGNVVGPPEDQLAALEHLEVTGDKEVLGITGHSSSYLNTRLPIATPNLNCSGRLYDGRQRIALNEGEADGVEIAILDAIRQTFCACQCACHHHRVRVSDNIVGDFPARLSFG